MAAPFESSIVRIYSNSGKVIGAGFLVSQKYILTCAHVVADALGLPRKTAEMPDAEITLDFPLVAAKQYLKAKVVFWRPLNPDAEAEDIAGLELENSPPTSQKALLVTSDDFWGHSFRVLGFPDGKLDGVFAVGELRGKLANGWVQLEDFKQPGYRLEPGFSGAPIWDEELQGVAGMAVAAEMKRPETKAAFMIPTEVLITAWTAIASCPYRGLFAFQQEDARFFFGREIFTRNLVDAVQRQSLVAIIGASGSGKSSVVFAGLIPHLYQQNNWLIESFRPKTHPLDELAAILVRLREPKERKVQQDFDAGKLVGELREGKMAVHTVLSRILAQAANSRLLLVVDQFEELYTSRLDVKERQLFLNQLLEAVELVQNFTLVLTLRADFLGYALEDRRFADALQNADLKLAPMSREELQRAIALPANKQGVSLEEGLAERILQAVADSPGNLPLLEFALTQLWVQRQNGQMTHAAYEAIGGVEKSLANHAETEFAKLKPEEQQRAQQVFVQLVRPGEGTEDTRRLATRNEVGENNWDLVTRLADARLVVTGRDETAKTASKETVEIVHETLIRKWGRLHGWMESDRSFRIWQELLRSRIRQWENAGQDEGSLLRSVPLGEAENWLKQRQDELSQAEQGFIQRSLALRERDRQQQERDRQLTLFGLTGGLILVSILAVVAFWLRWTAEVEGAGVTALKNFESGAGEIEALVSAMEAGQEAKKMAFWNSQCLQDCPATSPLLALQKILDNIHQTNQINTYQQGINSIRFLPKENQEEDLIVAGGEDGRVTWWDFQDKKLKRLKYIALHNNSIKSIDFSQDKKILATGASNGWVKLWDVSNSQKPPVFIKSMHHQCANGQHLGEYQIPNEDDKCSVKNVRFLPNNKLLATTGDDGTLRLWRLKGEPVVPAINAHKGSINSLNPSPDGQMLATAGEDGMAILWDLNGKRRAEFKVHQCNANPKRRDAKCSVNSVSFFPDGQQVTTGGNDDTVRLWNLAGTKLSQFEAHQDGVETVRISPDGKQLATAGKDGTVKLWDFNGKLQAELKGHQGSVVSIRFNDQGNTLATSGQDDGTVRLWAVPGKSLIKPKNPLTKLEGHTKTVGSVRFSPDRNLLATASDDDTVRLWKLEGDMVTLVRSFRTYQDGTNSVRFSPKKQKDLLATGGNNGTIKLWKYSGELLRKINAHSSAILSTNFNNNGDELATAGDDGMAKRWNLEGKKLAELKHQGKLEATRFSADGKLLATVGENGAWLWNINGKLLAELKGHQGYVRSVSFSQKENKLATAGDDGTIRLWDFSGRQVATPFKTYQSRVRSISFSPDGKLLATASATKKIRLWNLSGQQIAEFTGHQGNIKSADFSPNGKLLATASSDNTAILWRVRGLDQLLDEGCDRLKDYFITHPEEKKKLSVCP
ncbi:nSTAND1 domain-containing NTPase [Cylindrospermum sp. FACHB-282]|uniref:nSTAND1 domain-containing NTPase n=1 Tax=Cylindrospermum sp. FACHB-282 TaxID=2692794 RepID=UPI00168898D6|nr:trypsin-like peptidase domain-containing protein [Cylindrospermum sp. FACHB-282]MBD2385910.1 trypsin-like peptidase domain-containing protein [Cylindrospermum sp. FACHB-282]